jgi:hypothetical protein
MAEIPEFKQHDTFPHLLMTVEDAEGLKDLTTVDSAKLIAKNGNAKTIEGAVEAVKPPIEDPVTKELRNARYKWKGGDTDVAGTYEYEVELTIDAGATPPQVQSYPAGANPQFKINADLG